MKYKHLVALYALFMFTLWVGITNAQTDNKTTIIRIYALTTITTGETGRSVVPAQQFYFDKVTNNHSRYLPNLNPNKTYQFEIKTLDAKGSSVGALKEALKIIKYEDNLILPTNDTHKMVLLPLVLGTPWSGLTTAAAPVLHGFNFGLISSGATSVALSDTGDYEFFYRSVPSDEMQGAAVVELCKMFGWDKIAVLYINNNYGVYFAVSIVSEATDAGIKAFSVPFEQDDNTSYAHAAKQIKSLDVFVTVLIAYSEEVKGIIESALKPEGLWGYPYYLIGTESWFDPSAFEAYGLKEYVKGFVGTLPWRPNRDLDYGYYRQLSHDLGKIYNESQVQYDEIEELWQNAYASTYGNSSDVYNIKLPGIWSFYGWDTAAAVINVLNHYAGEHGNEIESIWNGTDRWNGTASSQSDIIHELDRIIKHEVQYVGVTGNISFDDNGDRKHAFYLLGNVVDDNGTVEYFTIFSFDYNSTKIDPYNDIVWPDAFAEKGLIPQSDYVIRHEIRTLDSGVVTAMSVLLLLSICFSFICAVLIIYYRENKAMKSVSWKINITSVLGGILLLLSIFLLGIDENKTFMGGDTSHYSENHGRNLDFLCNFRAWLLVLSFTLLFMPLFFKTYRIARIFRVSIKSLDSHEISDHRLFLWTGVCVLVDIVLLSLFMVAVSPMKRIYKHEGDLVSIDLLISNQYEYGMCSMGGKKNNSQYDTTLLIVITLWKAMELFFGGYAAMNVSQILGFKQIARFDETGSQIFSVFFTMSILCIAMSIYFVSDNSHINFHFILICILGLLIVNVVLIANKGLRLYFIIRGKDSKYLETAEEKMDAWFKMMYVKTRKYGKAHGWIENGENSKTESSFRRARNKIRRLKRRVQSRDSQIRSTISESNTFHGRDSVDIGARARSSDPDHDHPDGDEDADTHGDGDHTESDNQLTPGLDINDVGMFAKDAPLPPTVFDKMVGKSGSVHELNEHVTLSQQASNVDPNYDTALRLESMDETVTPVVRTETMSDDGIGDQTNSKDTRAPTTDIIYEQDE